MESVLQRQCGGGLELEQRSCSCQEAEVSSCTVSPLQFSSSHPARVATYVGILAVGLVAITILIAMYFMASRKRPYTDLR